MTQPANTMSHAGGSRPLGILAAAIALTAVVVGVRTWGTWNSHQAIASLLADALRLQELRGTILQFEEVLTMSARMAAATGDDEWERRYQQHEPVLDAAIKEAIDLAPNVYESETAAKTNTANLALVAVEKRAFELVRQGKRGDATELLFSEAYQKHKELYADGMTKLDAALELHIQEQLESHNGQRLLMSTIGLVAVIVLTVAWIVVFLAVRTYINRQMLTEKALEDAHRQLQLRVEERTKELAQANRDLETEILERRQAEDYTDNVIRSMNDMLVVVAPDSRLVTVNEATRKSLGYSEEELIGQPASLLFSEEEEDDDDDDDDDDATQLIVSQEALPVRRTMLRRLVKEGFISHIERSFLTKSGDKIPVRMSGSVMRDNDGTIRGIVCVAQDITERKQAEEALRESEEKFRTISASAQDAIIMMNGEGEISFWNEAARLTFGYTPEEALGKNLHTLLAPERFHEAHFQAFPRFRETGQGAAVGNTLELIGVRKNGDEFPLELALSAVRIKEEWHAVGVLRDTTERKRTENDLRQAHAETKHLLESIPSILISLDENDRIAAWNSAAENAFGIAAEDMIGSPLGDCGIQWDTGPIMKAISACRTDHRPTGQHETRFKRQDGRKAFLGFSVSPMESDGSKTGHVLIIAKDITESKILESQWAQTQKLESIGQLAAGIAHEINTPTQFVSDNTHFLQSTFPKLQDLLSKYGHLLAVGRAGPLSPELLDEVETAAKKINLGYLLEQIPEAINDSLEGLDRVARIVRAMKDFSHPGQEDMCAADLNKAIESTITVARNEWKYVAEMVMDLDPSLPLVPCVLGDFNQVILNIVVNAAHAIAGVVGDGGQGKGTITVSTRQDGNEAEIRISDTGTGIPEEHRSKVFDHFFTTKGVGKGTGQGLTIAHSVITAKHGGTLTFETEMGKGTTFIIRLPIEAKSAAAEETPQHEEACSIRG